MLGQQATQLAKSPNSLICCVLLIRVTLFEGRNLKLVVVSTQTAHFVDRCHNLVLASTEILVFMDKTAQLEPTPLQQTPR